MPPKNSAAITSVATGAGMPCLPNASTVPLNPAPPHQPSIFCAPCAKKIAPSASRMTSGPRRVMRASFGTQNVLLGVANNYGGSTLGGKRSVQA